MGMGFFSRSSLVRVAHFVELFREIFEEAWDYATHSISCVVVVREERSFFVSPSDDVEGICLISRISAVEVY